MSRRIKLLLGGIAFFYAAYAIGCRDGENKTSFRPDLKPQTSYYYLISDSQQVRSEGGDMSISSLIEVDYRRLEDSAGFQVLQTTVNRVAAKLQSPIMKVSFDSKDGVAPMPSQSALEPMFQLLNKSYLIYLNREGAIDKVASLSSAVSEKQEDSLLLQVLGQSFDFYPEHPVAVGESWKTKLQLPVQGVNTTLNTTYTFEALRGDTAFLKSTATLAAPEKNVVVNNIKMRVNLSGTQTGKLKVIVSEGRLEQASFSSKITGTFNAQGQEMKSVTEGWATIISQ